MMALLDWEVEKLLAKTRRRPTPDEIGAPLRSGHFNRFELEVGGTEVPEGLSIGSAAPEFDLPDLTGERRTLAQFCSQPLLLIFFNPDCGFCRDLAPKLAALPHPQPLSHPMGEGGRRPGEGSPLVLVITTGDAEKNRQFFAEHKMTGPVLLQNDGELAKAYQANGTPTGCLISAEGKTASELAIGAEVLLKLADGGPHPQPLSHPMGEGGQRPGEGDRTKRFSNRSLARSRIARNGLKAGTPAPQFRLPRLDGGELALEDLRGNRVLLVFSDPDCGPCDALAVTRWRASRVFSKSRPRNPAPPSETAIRASRNGHPTPIRRISLVPTCPCLIFHAPSLPRRVGQIRAYPSRARRDSSACPPAVRCPKTWQEM